MEILTWYSLISSNLFDLFNYYLEQEKNNKSNWTVIVEFIIMESIRNIINIIYDRNKNNNRLSQSLKCHFWLKLQYLAKIHIGLPW